MKFCEAVHKKKKRLELWLAILYLEGQCTSPRSAVKQFAVIVGLEHTHYLLDLAPIELLLPLCNLFVA
jgi:hypothetical protein